MGNLSPAETWGFYLFDKAFDGEPELRYKIGVVWLYALMDLVEAQQRVLPNVARKPRRTAFQRWLTTLGSCRTFACWSRK